MTKFNAAFWKWFGDSKVVDSKGNPLVVYHGTQNEFQRFQPAWETLAALLDKMNITDKAPWTDVRNLENTGEFYFFAEDEETAISYANGGIVLSCFLRVNNPPKNVFDTNFDAIDYLKTHPKNDGAQYFDTDASGHPGGMAWVVRKPKQIKLFENDGTWDADDPDIRSNPEDFGESKDWGADEYFARLENAIRDSKSKIFADAGDYAIIRLRRKDGVQLIVHQTSQSGKNNWQVSWLEKDDTPSMHTLFKKRDDALASIAGAGNGPSIGLPFEWEVVETRNIRKS